MRTVCDGPRILAPDVLRRKLNIKHGGVNLRMPHQVLKSGQGDAGPHHISSEGMPKSVGVGGRDLTAQSMMAEQRAEPRRRHGLTTPATL
jgi:hypothetical protein